MILAWPWFALALALPLLVRFGLPPVSRTGRARLAHAGFPLLLPQAGQPLWRMALCWCALVLALCRPQWQEAPLIHYQASRDLILAVDLSDSMRTQDMLDEGEQRDRLSAVRQQIAHLIGERPPAGTDPRARFRSGGAHHGARRGHTAGPPARRPRTPHRPAADHRWRNTAGNAEPLTEARRAAAAGIRLYTLGVGADPDTFASPLGGADPSAELDEPLLQQLAELGHGRYFRARSQADLSAINQAIDTLEPAARPQTLYRPHHELYPWPLALAWLLLVWPARLRWPGRRTDRDVPEPPHE